MNLRHSTFTWHNHLWKKLIMEIVCDPQHSHSELNLLFLHEQKAERALLLAALLAWMTITNDNDVTEKVV